MTLAQSRGLNEYGRKTLVSRDGGCAICNHLLREETLIGTETILLCDGCGRVWLYNNKGLLYGIGKKREVI
jgi:hypothetical protein